MTRRKTDKFIFRLALAGMLLSAALSGMAIHAMWKFNSLMVELSNRIEEERAVKRFSL